MSRLTFLLDHDRREGVYWSAVMSASPQVFRSVAAGTAWWAVGIVGVCLTGGAVMADPPLVSGASVDNTVVDTGTEPASRPAAELIEAARQLKSADTVEDLLPLDGLELYDRLALWLLDASTGEIAKLWDSLATREELDRSTRELLFDRWTRIDPEGAVRAAQGTGKGDAWGAWARHDPDAAIAHTKNLVPESVASAARFPVIYSISRHHPDRVLEVLEKHPEFDIKSPYFDPGRDARRKAAEEQMTDEDPKVALEALRKDGFKGQLEPLERWSRNDPQAALDWVLRQSLHDQHRLLNCLLGALRRENSRALPELAAKQPPGRVRRLIESSRFQALVDDDPEAALEEALATGVPRLAAERLAQLGTKLLHDDPDRAFAVHGKLLEACPIPISVTRRVGPAGSSSSADLAPGEVRNFQMMLAQADPGRALRIALDQWPGSRQQLLPTLAGSSSAWSLSAPAWISECWRLQDLQGYCDWVREYPAGDHRDFLAEAAAKAQANREFFKEAIEWAESVDDEKRKQFVYEMVLFQWISKDRAAAEEWFKQADLSPKLQDRLQRRFNHERR